MVVRTASSPPDSRSRAESLDAADQVQDGTPRPISTASCLLIAVVPASTLGGGMMGDSGPDLEGVVDRTGRLEPLLVGSDVYRSIVADGQGVFAMWAANDLARVRRVSVSTMHWSAAAAPRLVPGHAQKGFNSDRAWASMRRQAFDTRLCWRDDHRQGDGTGCCSLTPNGHSSIQRGIQPLIAAVV